MLQKLLLFTAVAGTLLSARSSMAATVISFSPNAGTPGLMIPTDLAGAPGVRSGNWNNFTSTNATLGNDEAVLYEDGTSVAAGFQMTFSIGPGIYGNRTGDTSNDPQMYNGVTDLFEGGVSTATFSNIPFATYDLYIYMRDDGVDRVGGFTAGGITYYARGGAGIPATTGTGYVLSSDTTITNGDATSVDAGNYVVFRNLTDPNLVLTLFAADGSTATERSKVGGFQIVQSVPEPSRALLLLAGVVAALGIRRRGRCW